MRKERREYCLFWLFLALVCWITAFIVFLGNRQGNREFTGYYDSPVLTGRELEVFIREREGEDSFPSISAWQENNGESFTGAAGVSQKGLLLKVRKDMKTLFARQLVLGNFPWQEDEQGCVISTGLSQELFGTSQGIGCEIQVQGETYMVRGIVTGEENLLACWAGEEERLENFRLSWKSALTPGSQAVEFLYQMSGEEPEGFFEGNLYGALSRFFLFLPLVCFCFLSGIRTLLAGKREREKGKKIFFLAFGAGFLLLFLFCLWKSFRFSLDYFPSMWSELSFYPELVQEKIQIFQKLMGRRLCQGDVQILLGTGKTILLGILSLVFSLLAIRGAGRKKNWHFSFPVHRIKEKRK